MEKIDLEKIIKDLKKGEKIYLWEKEVIIEELEKILGGKFVSVDNCNTIKLLSTPEYVAYWSYIGEIEIKRRR